MLEKTEDKFSKVELDASKLLLNYVENTQKSSINQLNSIHRYEIEKYMQLDTSTRKNLEILEANREKTKKGSLLWVLDETVTAMGGRALRHWLEAPLLDKSEIIKRQNAVEVLTKDNMMRNDLQDILKTVYDIERLIAKIVGGSANAREMISLKNSLKRLPDLKNMIATIVRNSDDQYFTELYQSIDVLDDVYTLIDQAIIEDAGINIKEGGIIKSEFDERVEEYRKASTDGQNWLMELEANEKERTGIKGKWLRVGYNRVFGYYIEVTNSYKNMVPEDRYIRKQTLAGAERYITEELKEIEDKILGAKDKLVDIEYTIFCDIRRNIADQVIRIQKQQMLFLF